MRRENFLYRSCYCEENIWHLAREERFAELETVVVIVSGEGRYRRFWCQANAESPDAPVYWDYHVILLVYDKDWWVWDLDTRLELPVRADIYFRKTFLQQKIDITRDDIILRLISAAEYVSKLSSDRAHMKLPSGEWLAPPPEWPMIIKGKDPNLLDWINIHRAAPGKVLMLTDFIRDYLSSTTDS